MKKLFFPFSLFIWLQLCFPVRLLTLEKTLAQFTPLTNRYNTLLHVLKQDISNNISKNLKEMIDLFKTQEDEFDKRTQFWSDSLQDTMKTIFESKVNQDADSVNTIKRCIGKYEKHTRLMIFGMTASHNTCKYVGQTYSLKQNETFHKVVDLIDKEKFNIENGQNHCKSLIEPKLVEECCLDFYLYVEPPQIESLELTVLKNKKYSVDLVEELKIFYDVCNKQVDSLSELYYKNYISNFQDCVNNISVGSGVGFNI